MRDKISVIKPTRKRNSKQRLNENKNSMSATTKLLRDEMISKTTEIRERSKNRMTSSRDNKRDKTNNRRQKTKNMNSLRVTDKADKMREMPISKILNKVDSKEKITGTQNNRT